MKSILQLGSTLWLVVVSALACGSFAVFLLHSWATGQTQSVEAHVTPDIEYDEPIQRIAVSRQLDKDKVELGRQLFHDTALSRNNRVSCSTCHDLKTGGTDNRVRSIGVGGAVGVINTPTVFNSALNFSQFWDGRAATLEAQIDDPIQSKLEMGSTWPAVVGNVKQSPRYVEEFREIYQDDVSGDHIKESISEFERSLSTPGSRFDRYLALGPKALTSRELQGYKLFKSFGCASCHQGMNVGGNMYQKFGVMEPYFEERGHITKADRGRFNVTGEPTDMYMFKVPSLRNVALTAPYFHDGSALTLADAVRLMGKYQLGRQLTTEEIDLIVDFLKTLTGELNGKPL